MGSGLTADEPNQPKPWGAWVWLSLPESTCWLVLFQFCSEIQAVQLPAESMLHRWNISLNWMRGKKHQSSEIWTVKTVDSFSVLSSAQVWFSWTKAIGKWSCWGLRRWDLSEEIRMPLVWLDDFLTESYITFLSLSIYILYTHNYIYIHTYFFFSLGSLIYIYICIYIHTYIHVYM